MWIVVRSGCEPIHPRWAFSSLIRDGVVACGGTPSDHGRVSVLWTRCGLHLDDPGAVSALLAGSGSAGALWHGPVPKPAPLESSLGVRCWTAVSAYVAFPDRLNQIEPLLQQARSAPLREVPPVVQFDGIWLRMQTQTDTVKLDTRQRPRKKRVGKKVVLLVALGFWTDGSGRREILDWQVADGESKAAWEPFVHRLWERGVQPETGLQAVIREGCGELGEALAWVYGTTIVEQRCIFNKLRNVADKSREELKGERTRTTRKRLMYTATALYQAHIA